MRSKKSQITVFIIIGVILLFSAALVFYIKERVGVPEREVEVAVEKVPTEIQPAQEYVTNCIEKVSTEAIKKIGLRGGYLSTEEQDFPLTLVKFNSDDNSPTESDTVPFPPGSETRVPYWQYMNSPNDCSTCSFKSLQPPLFRTEGANSIESQIDRYVNSNLRKCLNNFEPFRKEGFAIEEKGDIKTTTFVNPKRVLVSVTYPVELRKEQTYRMEKFAVNLNVRLQDLYDIADFITRTSERTRFLGVATLNWIAAFSDLDSNKLPPLADYDVSYNEVSWRASDVEKNLKGVLESYVQVIQLGGTREYRDPRGYSDPLLRGLVATMSLPQDVATGVDAKFLYLGWPIYLDFGTENLGPQEVQFPLLEIFPFKDYSFAYDISYPVVIKLSDPDAFNGRGYNFMFALETNIRANEPINASYSRFYIPYADERTSFLCEAAQRTAGPLTIITTDASNKKPLDGVAVTFVASQQCTVGTTVINNDAFTSNYNKAVLIDNFPSGIGTLRFTKSGYVAKEIPYITSPGVEDVVEVELEPVKKINATLVKLTAGTEIQGIDVSNPSSIVFTEEEISSPDFGSVAITRLNTENDPLGSGIFIPSENETEILLSPGKYKVSIGLIYNQSLI
ncbi:hypothetical protein KY308_00630, partial [Candidatus Woesearchaeota archaeon]|nr:hypothetical protein [Candidatus Woesearchaeota archaeon]